LPHLSPEQKGQAAAWARRAVEHFGRDPVNRRQLLADFLSPALAAPLAPPRPEAVSLLFHVEEEKFHPGEFRLTARLLGLPQPDGFPWVRQRLSQAGIAEEVSGAYQALTDQRLMSGELWIEFLLLRIVRSYRGDERA